jgi:hypothetical protein
MKSWLPIIIATVVLLGVGGTGYYFKDNIVEGKDKVMDWADPDMNRYIGQQYFGGKKTKHRRHKKGNKSRRK